MFQVQGNGNVEVVTYNDLKSTDSLLPLLDQAFRWPFNPRSFKKLIKIDPRLTSGPIGFCAVEKDKVLGFVGVLDIPTRTLDGRVEYVGGIYGVATLPSHTQRRISTILMNRAHKHFREKGYRFSFLTTSHTIIAHEFYAKLDYKDVTYFPSAYKVLASKKARTARKEKPSKVDFDEILRVYNECTKDKTGFVVRSIEFLKMVQKDQGLKPKHWIVSKRGYTVFKEYDGGIWIREIIASNSKEMQKLLTLIEEKAKDIIYDRAVLDDTLVRVYEARGYSIESKSHGVLMANALSPKASVEQTYGNNLYMGSLDWF
jgi:GNAT superfamily N-acetyltransferase